MADDPNKADFDWLYRREPEAEPTAVIPSGPQGAAPQATPTQPPAPTAPQPVSGYPQPGAYPPPSNSTARGPAQAGPQGSPSLVPGLDSTGGPKAPAKPKKKKRHVLRVISLLIVLWLVFMIGTPIYAVSRIKEIELTGISDRPAEQPGTAVLLVGSDSREDLTPEERSKLGTGSTGGQRTDTIMLLYTPPSGEPALISFPRDSFVSIPGNGDNKINAAYAFGGASLLVETVEQNTGIRIDGYLEIGFLGIVEMVDAVGGVEVCLDDPIVDKDSHLDLPAGCQTLDGTTALGYVRMRKADPKGDLGRVQRQQEMIGLIAKKAMSPAIILNPVSYWNLNMAASGSLTKSSDTSLGTLATAGMSFLSIAKGDGYQLTVPISNPNATTSAGSSVLWDDAKAEKMFKLIASGKTEGLDQFED